MIFYTTLNLGGVQNINSFTFNHIQLIRKMSNDRCPENSHSVRYLWIPVGVLGRKCPFGGGGIHLYCVEGRFCGHLSFEPGRRGRSASRSIELAQRATAAADHSNGRRRCPKPALPTLKRTQRRTRAAAPRLVMRGGEDPALFPSGRYNSCFVQVLVVEEDT